MTEDLKKRLIGAAVLVSLAVIFIPMLLEEETVIDSSIYTSNIPDKKPIEFKKPAFDEKQLQQKKQELDFGSSIKPAEDAEVKEVIAKPASDEAETTESSETVTTRVGLTSWIIQAGSFSSRENAKKVVERLRQAGYDTHLETAQVKTQTVYRVRVGPEVERSRADKLAEEISKKFFLNAKVMRYP